MRCSTPAELDMSIYISVESIVSTLLEPGADGPDNILALSLLYGVQPRRRTSAKEAEEGKTARRSEGGKHFFLPSLFFHLQIASSAPRRGSEESRNFDGDLPDNRAYNRRKE